MTPLRDPNEGLDEALTTSRGRIVRNALVAGGGFVAGGVILTGLSKQTASAASRAQDREILRFLLQLEYLQEDFYADALEKGALRGELREFAEIVAEHERAHVEFLERKLGGAATRPTFQFADRTSDPKRFADTAVDVEELTAAAYVGQGANLTRRLISDAARICAIEARHAAWIRDLVDKPPAPRAADPARAPTEVRAALRQAGFLGES
jgi:hypothetical protein